MYRAVFLFMTLFVFFFSCKSNKNIVVSNDNNDDVIFYTQVEVQPLFDGKNVDRYFREYASKNLNMVRVAEAHSEGARGTAIVEFIIEKNGSMTNVQIVQHVHPIFDNEVHRVITRSPNKWTPGKQNGEPVRVKYQLPFILK